MSTWANTELLKNNNKLTSWCIGEDLLISEKTNFNNFNTTLIISAPYGHSVADVNSFRRSMNLVVRIFAPVVKKKNNFSNEKFSFGPLSVLCFISCQVFWLRIPIKLSPGVFWIHFGFLVEFLQGFFSAVQLEFPLVIPPGILFPRILPGISPMILVKFSINFSREFSKGLLMFFFHPTRILPWFHSVNMCSLPNLFTYFLNNVFFNLLTNSTLHCQIWEY